MVEYNSRTEILEQNNKVNFIINIAERIFYFLPSREMQQQRLKVVDSFIIEQITKKCHSQPKYLDLNSSYIYRRPGTLSQHIKGIVPQINVCLQAAY